VNTNDLDRLTNFVTLLTEATSWDALIQVTLTGIFGLLPADIVEANLIDPLNGRIVPHRLTAPRISGSFQHGARSSYAVGEGFTGWLVEHGGILHIADCREVDEPRPASADVAFPFRSFLGSSLQAGEALIGTLEIAHHEPDMYTPEHIAVFQLAIAQVGAAMRSLRLDKENNKHIRLIAALQELRGHGWWDVAPGTHGRSALELLASQLELDLLAEFAFEEDMMKVRYISGAQSVHAPSLERWVLDTGPTTTLGSVLRTHAYWLSNSIGEDPVFPELGLPPETVSGPIKHLLFAPLGSKGKPAGMLLAARTSEPRPFDISEAELFVALAQEYSQLQERARQEHAPTPQAGALDPAQSSKETELGLQRTESLLRLAAEISTSLDLERVLDRTLQILIEVTPAERGAIFLLDAEGEHFTLRATAGTGPQLPPGGIMLDFGFGAGLSGWSLSQNQTHLVDDLLSDTRWIAFDADAQRYASAAVAPLVANEERLGVILLLSTQPASFLEDVKQTLSTAAGQVAVAIKNTELYALIREQTERMGSMLRTQQVDSSTSRAILESIADGVVVTDDEHRVVLFNAAAARILGIEGESILGHPVFDFIGLYGAEGQRWASSIRGWKQNPPEPSMLSDVSERLQLEDDRVLSIHPAPVVLGQEFLGTVSIFRDITREVEVDRLKSEFVATVSHELRTPMTSIKGFVDLVLMGAAGALNAEQRRFLNIVKNNTERLEILVNDLLDISRIEAGKVTLSFQPIDVHELLHEIKLFVERQRREQDKQIELVIETPPELPRLWGDPERVRQILTNLVENAFNYTPEGGKITLRADRVNDQIELAVEDNGIGISLNEQGRIFERFFRGEQSLIMGVAGTGLGLAIVLNLVEMHGGRIWVSSEGIPGRGTTFTLSLPISDAYAITAQEGEPA
jgi:PAS domain S-box-containing protein